MLEDIAVSDDIDPAFQEYTIKHNCTFEYHLTFKILTRGAWPVLEGHSVTVPPQVNKSCTLESCTDGDRTYHCCRASLLE